MEILNNKNNNGGLSSCEYREDLSAKLDTYTKKHFLCSKCDVISENSREIITWTCEKCTIVVGSFLLSESSFCIASMLLKNYVMNRLSNNIEEMCCYLCSEEEGSFFQYIVKIGFCSICKSVGLYDMRNFSDGGSCHKAILQSGFTSSSGEKKEEGHSESQQVENVPVDVGSTMRAVDDAVAEVKDFDLPKLLRGKLMEAPSDGVDGSIGSYLSKPHALYSGSLTLNDLPTTFPHFYTMDAMRTSLVFREKLRGALALRYTTVLTFQVNANRFQQGKYILAFLPTGGMCTNMPAGNNSALNWINMHRATAMQITQLHHVELDVNTDTSVQLRIPFNSAFPAAPFMANPASMRMGDPGIFFLYPYVPLSSTTGNTTATFTLWVHYEDVEMLGNTVGSSGPAPTVLSESLEKNKGTVPPATLQSGFKRRPRKAKNVNLFDDEQSQDGPITSTLKRISEGTGALAGIPLLSNVMSPLSWSADVLAQTASSFGWSKPNQLDSIVRVSGRPHTYVANADQKDDSQPLSLISSNMVSTAAGFSGVDEDEMSLDYIKSIFAYFRRVDWTIAQAVGTELFKGYLTPSYFRNDVPGKGMHMTPVCWASSFFSKYAGGFDIRIKIAKTEFHSGRLLFVFNPYESSCVTENFTFADTTYLQKTVLDIRECNEFTIRVPYVSAIPWRTTYLQGESNAGSEYGSFTIYVLDTLTAPETVNTSITLLFEIAGSPSLKFAVPTNCRHVAYVPAELQSGFSQTRNLTEGDNSNVGGTNSSDLSNDLEEICIGEKILSLRQVLKRGGFINHMIPTNEVTSTNSLTINAFAWKYPLESEIGTTGAAQRFSFDPYSQFSAVYCLQRGGVRMRFLNDSNSGGLYIGYRNAYITEDTDIYTWSTAPVARRAFYQQVGSAQVALEKGYMGGFAVQLPFYHHQAAAVSGAQGICSDAPYEYAMHTGANANVLGVWFSETVTTDNVEFWRAGSDDCNFGMFVSIPPVSYIVNEPPAP
ncbi:MAG: capsid protein [Varroa dicistrovirus 2]|nr:MAG: capsid protein [Varroa dicistrovirus 2]